jgi:hypothetical protein
MSLPKWLRESLGTPTRGRGAKAAKCIVCKADVIVGFDEDACARAVVVDPHPLSELGEALALIEGRRSYLLAVQGEGMALWVRDQWQIAGTGASDKVWVFTDHKCHTVPFPGVKVSAWRRRAVAKVPSDTDPPPF